MDAVEDIESMNMLGDMLVDLVQTGSPDLENYSIVSISLSPATPPTLPQVPVIPPSFENITKNYNITLVPIDGGNDNDDVIMFTVPSELVITKAPPKEVVLLTCIILTHYIVLCRVVIWYMS